LKRTIIKLIFALVLGALLLTGLAAGLSRVVYGRSLRASVYTLMLRRRYGHPRTPEAETERLEARREAGEKPYRLPEKLTLRAALTESEREGMQVFTLNDGGDAQTTVLYLHGGAYINSFNAYQWRFMDRLATEANCRVVAPAYHLAPWADHTRAYRDLTGLYRDLISEHPGRRLLLMGDSAGGGLALGLAEALAAAGDALPEALILFSPWVDVSMDNPDIAAYIPRDPILHLELCRLHGQYWAGSADAHHWQVSPLYGDMAGLPPVTVYCGTHELLCPDILLACDRLTAAGVQTTLHVGRGLNHDYPLMPIPEAEAAVRQVVAMVRGA